MNQLQNNLFFIILFELIKQYNILNLYQINLY